MGWREAWKKWRIGGPGPVGVAAPEARYVVLDTELTGLDPRRDDIVSLGAVRMRGAGIELGGAFHELVNPKAALEGRSVVIHGITPSQVQDRPPIDGVLLDFLAFSRDAVLVGHCLSVDLAFLNREARRVTGKPLPNRAVDTLSMFGWLRRRQVDHPGISGAQGLSLFDLAAGFDLPVVEGHTALGDACLTAQLFQRFLPLLAQSGVTDLESLLRVAHPDRQAEYLTPATGPLPL